MPVDGREILFFHLSLQWNEFQCEDGGLGDLQRSLPTSTIAWLRSMGLLEWQWRCRMVRKVQGSFGFGERAFVARMWRDVLEWELWQGWYLIFSSFFLGKDGDPIQGFNKFLIPSSSNVLILWVLEPKQIALYLFLCLFFLTRITLPLFGWVFGWVAGVKAWVLKRWCIWLPRVWKVMAAKP